MERPSKVTGYSGGPNTHESGNFQHVPDIAYEEGIPERIKIILNNFFRSTRFPLNNLTHIDIRNTADHKDYYSSPKEFRFRSPFKHERDYDVVSDNGFITTQLKPKRKTKRNYVPGFIGGEHTPPWRKDTTLILFVDAFSTMSPQEVAADLIYLLTGTIPILSDKMRHADEDMKKVSYETERYLETIVRQSIETGIYLHPSLDIHRGDTDKYLSSKPEDMHTDITYLEETWRALVAARYTDPQKLHDLETKQQKKMERLGLGENFQPVVSHEGCTSGLDYLLMHLTGYEGDREQFENHISNFQKQMHYVKAISSYKKR